MIRLPASRQCFALNVMSGKEQLFDPATCDKMIERSIILTSEAWKLLRGDVQSNCQMTECKQISGAADGLFLAIDKALQPLP